jgi:hypothetical protein
MNRKNRKTLARIFERPTRPDITWPEVESLLRSCGAELREGRGSRVTVMLKSQILGLHKPHPQKELKRYAVENIREYLESLDITPETGQEGRG